MTSLPQSRCLNFDVCGQMPTHSRYCSGCRSRLQRGKPLEAPPMADTRGYYDPTVLAVKLGFSREVAIAYGAPLTRSEEMPGPTGAHVAAQRRYVARHPEYLRKKAARKRESRRLGKVAPGNKERYQTIMTALRAVYADGSALSEGMETQWRREHKRSTTAKT